MRMVARGSSEGLIRAIRAKGGFSQESLARELGVSFATVNSWERGRSHPRTSRLKDIHRLAESLNIRTDLTVLAIDDDPVACAIVTSLVEGSRVPARIESTTDPSTALILCGALEPDLILIDVLMPGVDGFEVIERLQEIRPNQMPLVVFVTASSDPELENRAHAMGHRILRKPVRQESIDGLLDTVSEGMRPAWR